MGGQCHGFNQLYHGLNAPKRFQAMIDYCLEEVSDVANPYIEGIFLVTENIGRLLGASWLWRNSNAHAPVPPFGHFWG